MDLLLQNYAPSVEEGFYHDHFLYPTLQTMSEEEAFIGILLAAAAPEGTIYGDDTIDFFNFLAGQKKLEYCSKELINAHLVSRLVFMTNHGVENLVDSSVNNLPRKGRMKIFRLACEIVYPKGEDNLAGEDLLKDIIIQLGLNDIKAREIAWKIKNRNKNKDDE